MTTTLWILFLYFCIKAFSQRAKFGFLKRISSIFCYLQSKNHLRKYTDGGKIFTAKITFLFAIFSRRGQKRLKYFFLFCKKKQQKVMKKWKYAVSLKEGREVDEFCYMKSIFFEKKVWYNFGSNFLEKWWGFEGFQLQNFLIMEVWERNSQIAVGKVWENWTCGCEYFFKAFLDFFMKENIEI